MAGEAKQTGLETRRRRGQGRARFPLALRFFLATGLVIAVVVVIAVGATIRRSHQVARTTVDKAISNAGMLYKDVEAERLKLLTLGAQSLARNPNFASYIQASVAGAAPAEAAQGFADSEDAEPLGGQQPPPGETDLVSILDIAEQNRESLESDLVIITDDQGILIARTDVGATAGPRQAEDLYEGMPLLMQAIDGAERKPVEGVVETKGRLFHAAIAPIDVGASGAIQGYVVNAKAIDEKFANKIAETTQTGVAFFPASQDGASSAPRSTNAPAVASLGTMPEIGQVIATGAMSPAHSATIDRSDYILTAEPLSAGPKTLGVAVFVRSLDAELAPFREIERTLLYAGALALVLAFLVSFLIARRITRPIEELAAIAERVTDGDLSVLPKSGRADEVGVLAGTFGELITALRDKHELEELYEQMAARGDVATVPARRRLPETGVREGVVLVTDLRGVPASPASAESIVKLLDEIMAMQEGEVSRQNGEVLELYGHQLVAHFPGDRGAVRALRAARAIGEELADRGEKEPIGFAGGMATGTFVAGPVRLVDDDALAISGEAPLLATILALEATTGSVLASADSADRAGQEFSGAATIERLQLRRMPNPVAVVQIPLGSMSAGMMRVLSGGTTETTMRMDVLAAAQRPVGVPRDLESGRTFASRYRIEGLLGRGGMGVVYRATDTQLDEVVAIKTLPASAMNTSPEDVERFKREIRLARKITHRNVLRTFDYGEAEGFYFISMEFVKGYALADMLEENGQLAPRVALGVSRQICRGLEAAHEQGIIHRDIKPQNVLIDHKGEVKLMDFGIARMQEAEAMTQQGMIIGTPHYMSPEQVQGLTLDARSDVYSMGVMMYEMLCGTRPFNSSSLTSVLTAHISEVPQPPIALRPEIGGELNEVILRCLAKSPAARYAGAGELLEALERLATVPAVA
ncbi:MAG: protein kinase domain-containing protein [Thermoanaerobaculia bacterium]